MCLGPVICMKFILCLLNAATSTAGLVIAAGGYLFRSFDVSGLGYSAAKVVMAVGVIISTLGAVGCVAGYLRARTLLRTYAGTLVMLTVLTIALIVYGYNAFEKKNATHTYVKSLNRYRHRYNSSPTAKKEVDKIQSTLRCCGSLKATEWTGIYEYPGSCCPHHKRDEKRNLCAKRDLYTRGCAKLVDKVLRQIMISMRRLMMGVAIVMSCTAAAALCVSIF